MENPKSSSLFPAVCRKNKIMPSVSHRIAHIHRSTDIRKPLQHLVSLFTLLKDHCRITAVTFRIFTNHHSKDFLGSIFIQIDHIIIIARLRTKFLRYLIISNQEIRKFLVLLPVGINRLCICLRNRVLCTFLFFLFRLFCLTFRFRCRIRDRFCFICLLFFTAST